MASSVTVIDYGIVNLANIVRALEFVGAKVQISDCPNEISRASRIVLPGVGAFGAGMEKLKEKRLDEALKSTPDDRPLMGICLGMQMLLDMSTEFGEHTGLGIIAGTVTSLDSRDMGIEQQKPKDSSRRDGGSCMPQTAITNGGTHALKMLNVMTQCTLCILTWRYPRTRTMCLPHVSTGNRA